MIPIDKKLLKIASLVYYEMVFYLLAPTADLLLLQMLLQLNVTVVGRKKLRNNLLPMSYSFGM